MDSDDIPAQDNPESSSINAPYDKPIPEADRKLFEYAVSDYYCDQCERHADFKYDGTLTEDTLPSYKCPTCDLTIAPTLWPEKVIARRRKRQRQNTPSPTTSVTKETSTTEEQTIEQLQATIQTLQETITQMASLIAELSPLKQTIAKLEKRVTQLENPSPNTCSKQGDSKATPPHTFIQRILTNPTWLNKNTTRAGEQSPRNRQPKPKPHTTNARRTHTAQLTFQSPPTEHKQFEPHIYPDTPPPPKERGPTPPTKLGYTHPQTP